MKEFEQISEDKLESPEAEAVLKLDIDPERQFVVQKPEEDSYLATFAIKDSKGKEVFDLRRLAGDFEVTLEFDEKAKTGSTGTVFNHVLVAAKDISGPRDIFKILHEVAHAGQYSSDRKAYAKQSEARTRLFLNLVTADQRPLFLETVTQYERDAWAKAIRYARIIKKESGADLFGLFANKKEFMGWMRVIGLNSYENELHRWGGPEPTKPEAMEEWKKREEELLKVSSESLQSSLEDAAKDLQEWE